MAFPKILQKLFANNGAGPKLREDVIPDTFLKTSGGTMTGQIKTSAEESVQSTTNDSGVRIYGGKGYGNGAYIALRGKDYSEKGIFTLCASDGTNSKLLKGSPDGGLSWANSDVLTAANGLKLSGGTMTGVIKCNGYALQHTGDAGALVIRGGTDSTSANIALYGKNHSTNAGWFTFQANNGTSNKYLIGKPDGSLLWGGNSVITSAGGTMTGYLQFNNGNNARIQSSTDDSHTPLLGGSGWSTGGRVVPYGKDHATYGGQTRLTACDGTNTKDLILKPDGTLTWVGNTVLTAANGVITKGGRGTMGGYNTPASSSAAITINASSNDDTIVTAAVTVTVSNGSSGQTWTKTVALQNASAKVSLGTSWKWVGGSAPTITANSILVVKWCGTFGIANLVSGS